MTYTEHGDEIVLQMKREDYDELLMIVGFGLRVASGEDPERFYAWLAFINELNKTNPAYVPYEIPADEVTDATGR